MSITKPVVSLITLLALLLFQSVHAAPGDVVETLTINNVTGDGRLPTSPQGIAYHNGFLYVVDFGTDRIYRVYPKDVLDTDNVTVLFSAGDSDLNLPITDTNTPPINSDGNPIGTCGALPPGQYCGGGGLTFARNYLWNASPITDDIIKIDPVDGDNLETENGLAALAFPSPTDMAYDGKHFWILDWQTNTISEVLPETGAILRTIPGPSTLPSYQTNPSVTNARPFGIDWDGQALWVSDQQEQKIYRVNPTDGSLLNVFTSPGSSPKGLAWDGEFLWHVDQGTRTLYKLESGVIPFGIIGCVEKNGRAVDGDVLLSQTAIADQSAATDIDGCFSFSSFTSGTPIQVKMSESGVDEKPVIALTQVGGSVNVTLTVGDNYVEPGFAATDTEDGDLTADVVATPDVIHAPILINTSVPNPTGVTIAYNVVDSAGNLADTVYRKVYVLEADITAPVITLVGANPLYVEQGTSYVEPGATATDARDGNISSSIMVTGTVNTNTAGTYTLSYNVSDLAGNAATTVTRSVIVRDTVRPVITLLGANPVTLEKGAVFTNPGATATDNINGNISASIVVSGTVSSNNVGSYVLVYNVADAAGNAAIPVSRTVNVVDTTRPVITRLGANPYNQELNTPFTDPGATASDAPGENLTASIVVSGSVNTALIGTYTLTYNVSDSAGNAAIAVTRSVIVSDTGAPSITLLGSNPLNHEQGTAFTDPGATASDAVDGNVTARIVIGGTAVNVNVAGSYNITYNVTDLAGNAATARTRTVIVADTTPPVLTLLGAANVVHPMGTAYTDAGATASDNINGNISASIVVTGSVNTAVAGTYILNYNVTDAAGNAAAPLSRTVVVRDTVPPVITLTGAASVNHEQGTIYTDQGATATDNVDGNLSASITTTGIVNASVAGTYTLTYRVTDAAGNSATPRTRTIIVADTGAPSITLLGSNPMNQLLGAVFTDPGATALDAVDGNITARIVVTGSVNQNTPGTYYLNYNVTDLEGNAATTITRSVIVADTIRPVISLLGANPLSLTQGATFTDPGATATDNIDGNISASIVVSGSVNTAVAGSYTLSYNVTDAAGNAATTVTRTVNVTNAPDTTPPVITLLGANPMNLVQGATFTDPGATATDNIDGNVTTSIAIGGAVDTATVGSYTLSYNVSDSSGNAATTRIRTVSVTAAPLDTVPPVITMLGSNPMSIERGTVFSDPGASATDNVDGDISASIVSSGVINTGVVGSYSLRYNVSDSSGNAATQRIRTVNVTAPVDTTPPVISLLGNNPINIVQGSTFTDPGATAADNIDGNISASIVASGTVNTATIGSYTRSYNVSDAAGNAATTVTRTVNVTSPADTVAPVITLLGSNPMSIVQGSVFTDPGATATDNVDGNITARIVTSGVINTGTVGTYTLNYNVADNGGNAATQRTRTVNVTAGPDGTPPVISLLGNNPMSVAQGATFTDPGATAADNIDGNISASIVAIGTVNTAIVGSYVRYYNVSDAAGNAAPQRSRTVNVVDVIAPVITRLGSATVTHVRGQLYTDAGATATDNIDGNITARVVRTGSVNVSTAGTYVLTYNVSDNAGNAATAVTRTVNVVAPTTITTQIETGTRTGGLVVGNASSRAGFTGSGYIDTNPLAVSIGNYIQFSSVNALATPYSLRIRYSSTVTGRLGVLLNGTSVGSINIVNTGGNAIWVNSAALTITPVTGTNTIRFTVQDKGGNIDSFTLTPP